MSNEIRKRSPAEWFLESFFQERNIKWILVLGVMIVFGSSLMLVTRQWDSWSPLWKALAIIDYSGAVFGCGELAYCRLGLRNTGTVMRSLTLLLLPLSFLAVHRLGEMSLVMQMSLLVLDGSLTAFAARRIFSEFLRGPQPTLVASYVALAVAGGVLTPLTGIAAPVVALILWAIFSIGTVKSARQVFWLAEEHQRPRVVGFVPILLLGAQFVTLFAWNCAAELSLSWLGLGCVLLAVPVLMTTDAIAKVFQQRTGDLVRPLPWSIMLPLFVGLVLCVAGVAVAAIPQAGRSLFSMALTPAAGLAAMMMLVAARRTKHTAFVWAGLIGAAMAYQATPAFFIETARLVVRSAASAVHEQRLPVAFYGLTWLPLILGSTFVAVRATRRHDELIAVPCRRFAMSVAMLLFALSFTHAKAIFPVAAAMTITFGLQAVLFSDRRCRTLAALAWTSLTASSQFFAGSIVGWPMSDDVHRLVMLAGAAALLVPLRSVAASIGPFGRDRTNRAEPFEWTSATDHATANVSLIHSLMIAAMWLVMSQPTAVVSWTSLGGFAAAGLLLVHAWLRLMPGLGELALAALLAVVVKSGLTVMPSDHWFLLTCVVPSLVMWFAGLLLAKRSSRFSLAFGRPSVRVSRFVLTALTGMSQVLLLMINVGFKPTEPNAWFALLPTAMTTLWLFDAARHRAADGRDESSQSSMAFAVLGCIAVLTTSGSVLIGKALLKFIPPVWAGIAAVAVITVRLRSDRSPADRTTSHGPIATAVQVIATATLLSISFGTLLVDPFTGMARIAGLIATGGLLLDSLLRRDRGHRDAVLMLGQWHVAMLVAHWMAPAMESIGDIFTAAAIPAALPVGLVLAASFTALRLSRDVDSEIEGSGIHNGLSVAAISYALLAAAITPAGPVGPISVAMAVATFVILGIGEFVLAVRRQRVDSVWMAQGISVAAVVWLLAVGAISIGHVMAMFACTIVAVVELVIAKCCERSSRLAFAAEAFHFPAHVLPLITVVIGIGRHLSDAPETWLGMNSLALLLSAAFYFWQGIESNEESEWAARRDRFVLSGVILNVALGLLWRELRFSDPQFFMIPTGLTMLWLVELLKREIPESYRDPLRYVGALTILVSPTFHIVSGSWLHLISLMICSVTVALLAIGLRLRALLYSGTAFLVADLVAMVIRGSIDHPNLLWLAGLAIGASVIVLGAACENHRERLLSRLRALSAELQTWT